MSKIYCYVYNFLNIEIRLIEDEYKQADVIVWVYSKYSRQRFNILYFDVPPFKLLKDYIEDFIDSHRQYIETKLEERYF